MASSGSQWSCTYELSLMRHGVLHAFAGLRGLSFSKRRPDVCVSASAGIHATESARTSVHAYGLEPFVPLGESAAGLSPAPDARSYIPSIVCVRSAARMETLVRGAGTGFLRHRSCGRAPAGSQKGSASALHWNIYGCQVTEDCFSGQRSRSAYLCKRRGLQ